VPHFQKAVFAFLDSETTTGFFKNVRHSNKHGCFCYGLWFRTAASEAGDEVKNVLMRYNRWGDGGVDIAPYWAAVQV
jgi:hypothetical protein